MQLMKIGGLNETNQYFARSPDSPPLDFYVSERFRPLDRSYNAVRDRLKREMGPGKTTTCELNNLFGTVMVLLWRWINSIQSKIVIAKNL